MGLPLTSHPTFVLNLPSTDQQVTYRPFLVKEEKILLVAQASEDKADIVRAIKQVIQNCIIEPQIDVNTLTTFDLEYFFIKLRSKSVQNIISLSYKDREDGKIYDVTVNLDDVEVKKNNDVTNKIETSPTTGILLRYPQISIMDVVEKIADPVEFNLAIMQSCIDCVYSGDEVLKTSDYTREEVRDFLETLDIKTYQQIQKFMDAMPHLHYEVSYTNTKDREVKIVLKTLTDFFTLG